MMEVRKRRTVESVGAAAAGDEDALPPPDTNSARLPLVEEGLRVKKVLTPFPT